MILALAWTYLVHLNRQMSASTGYDAMMANMGMTADRPWAAADVFFTFIMWTVMMIGMMMGAAAPTLLLFAEVYDGREGRGVRMAVLMFGLGYVMVWVGFSACAALAQSALHATAMSSAALATSSPYLGGAILIVAGAYQWMPWKGACLRQCRNPLGFLMTHWRDGLLGPLNMGLRSGMYCLGCCWALMWLLFVVGVMNLFAVAALTGFVLLEKIGPAGAMVARVAGVALVLSGVFLVAAKILTA